jgi:hypothetical protein
MCCSIVNFTCIQILGKAKKGLSTTNTLASSVMCPCQNVFFFIADAQYKKAGLAFQALSNIFKQTGLTRLTRYKLSSKFVRCVSEMEKCFITLTARANDLKLFQALPIDLEYAPYPSEAQLRYFCQGKAPCLTPQI